MEACICVMMSVWKRLYLYTNDMIGLRVWFSSFIYERLKKSRIALHTQNDVAIQLLRYTAVSQVSLKPKDSSDALFFIFFLPIFI